MSTNPNTVKSQHELTNEGGRKSDVLLSTIEELEKVKKENELLKEIIKDEMIKNGEIIEEIERLQKQLAIAVAGLQYYANEDIYIESHKVVNGNNEWTSEVMLDNGVKANYFLKRIEKLNK